MNQTLVIRVKGKTGTSFGCASYNGTYIIDETGPNSFGSAQGGTYFINRCGEKNAHNVSDGEFHIKFAAPDLAKYSKSSRFYIESSRGAVGERSNRSTYRIRNAIHTNATFWDLGSTNTYYIDEIEDLTGFRAEDVTLYVKSCSKPRFINNGLKLYTPNQALFEAIEVRRPATKNIITERSWAMHWFLAELGFTKLQKAFEEEQ